MESQLDVHKSVAVQCRTGAGRGTCSVALRLGARTDCRQEGEWEACKFRGPSGDSWAGQGRGAGGLLRLQGGRDICRRALGYAWDATGAAVETGEAANEAGAGLRWSNGFGGGGRDSTAAVEQRRARVCDV